MLLLVASNVILPRYGHDFLECFCLQAPAAPAFTSDFCYNIPLPDVYSNISLLSLNMKPLGAFSFIVV